MSREQNPRQPQHKIHSKCFESAAEFKYWENPPTNYNFINEEIKTRLNSGNAWYLLLQNLLSASLLPKHIKFKIYRILIFPVVLCGCETCSLTLREKHRLMVFFPF